MFWFKKKKVILDCFTCDATAHEYFKPASALKYQPAWYKELPGTITINNKEKNYDIDTVKHCIALRGLFKNSFILPSWSTYRFEISDSVDAKMQWFCSTKVNMLNHEVQQMDGFLNEETWSTFKLESPWFFKSSRFINYTWHDIVWHKKRLNGLSILPAVLDFSVNNHTNINMVFSFDNTPKIIIIEAGDPLVMITPNTEEDVEIKTHLVSGQEIQKIDLSRVYSPVTLNNKPASYIYFKKKKILENIEENNNTTNKCPFGFKKNL